MMEKRIELEKRGIPTEEVAELNLDNCRASQIEGLTEDFKSLESVSLINVGLVSLKGFPKLDSLRKLELSDNRISGTLNLLHGCQNLQYLNLSGNKIKDIEALEPLMKLPNLKNLDLFNNEVTGVDEYREKVFKLLENLQYLDGFNRNDEEAEEEDIDGEESDEDDDDDDEEGLGDEDEDDEDDDDIVDVDDDDDDDDDNEVDDEDDDDDDEDEEEEGQVGLEYLTKDGIEDEDEEEDDDYQQPADKDGEADDKDAEEDGVEDVDGDESRGKKRKHEEEGDDS